MITYAVVAFFWYSVQYTLSMLALVLALLSDEIKLQILSDIVI